MARPNSQIDLLATLRAINCMCTRRWSHGTPYSKIGLLAKLSAFHCMDVHQPTGTAACSQYRHTRRNEPSDLRLQLQQTPHHTAQTCANTRSTKYPLELPCTGPLSSIQKNKARGRHNALKNTQCGLKVKNAAPITPLNSCTK